MRRQAKRPSLVQDLLMLGDIYLALGWVAIQRLRHGPLWPWETRPHRPGRVVALRRLQQEGREEQETVTPKRPPRARATPPEAGRLKVAPTRF